MRYAARVETTIRCLILGTLGLLLATATDVAAQPAYLGPTPYTSRADSPFDTAAFGFCVEDFENGKFDIPGATWEQAGIRAPASFTDSVDEDDGEIDGSGAGGHSLSFSPLDPIFPGSLIIHFDPDRTNGLPTEVGIVWTDGGQFEEITFEAYGPDGESLLGPNGPYDHGDDSVNGETAEDRFYGATNPAGISSIRVADAGYLEVDHVQLNRCILCGDTDGNLDVTASDALFGIIAAIGLESCDLCVCDINDSGGINATDALSILQKSVGVGPGTSCPPCEFF